MSQTTGGAAKCTISPGGVSVSGLCQQAASLHINVEYRSILPVLALTIGGLALLALSAVLPKRSRRWLYPVLTVVVGAVTLGLSIWQWYNVPPAKQGIDIGGQVFFDHFSVLFSMLIAVAVILSAIASASYLQRERLDGVEAYVLMLMSATGAVLMAEAATLIMLFLGLEIMSIALYVMAAYHRRRTQSGEAGLKYFLLGSFSSALFLYGIALVYGATGSVSLAIIRDYLSLNILANPGILLAGLALLIVGLGFKVGAVPFHFWTPDVYQGSPTPFTGYMAAVAKAAGFAGLLRITVGAFTYQQTDWRPIIWIISVLSMVVGSVLAIASKDLKRMLAYSSISQAGYVLVGVQAGTATGTSAALFYLFTYTFIVIGSFAVVDVVQGVGEGRPGIGAIRGLSRRHPGLAAAMLVLLLAQAGVPFTSGFIGKFYVIQASVQQGQYYLAVIAMVAAAAAAFFYLRLALLMYSAPGDGSVEGDLGVFSAGLEPVASLDGGRATAVAVLEAPPTEAVYVPASITLVLLITVGFTVVAGLTPFTIDFAKAATTLL
ncbi:MAG TPA: NADH-quinone oxidoreductase subunit N [Acidimicrobiales bacterium]|nr:NADH-quinone oxidoreductase subunit N [Acidimicrobiales bacterium]